MRKSTENPQARDATPPSPKTFNVTIPSVPYEQLEGSTTRPSGPMVQCADQPDHQASAHVVSGQRAIDTVRSQPYGHVTLPWPIATMTTRSCSSPRYAVRQPGRQVEAVRFRPRGGADRWRAHSDIDEPIIAKVGEHMSRALGQIEADRTEW